MGQYDLGLMYLYGEGVQEDPSEGIRWLHQAAEQEHADAQYALGVLYANGQDVEQDESKGRRLVPQSR